MTSLLVVDDTEHVREMLADMLQLDGFDVAGQASSGEEAIAAATDLNPDVVVMDYRMDDMDGLDAAKKIKDTRPDQLIILYTAFLDPEVEERAREVGVTVCVGKGHGLTELERRITELCRDLAE
jgi:DNA-binding NarL/FixJ family response regulator